MTYTSIFDGANIITKKELCELLDLDTSRPGLSFSSSEIEQAYRKKALLVHPDKQHNKPEPMPVEACNVLMNDIRLARDYLLSGQDNIPGKAFLAKTTNSNEKNEWIDAVIRLLGVVRSSASTISTVVPWASRLSHNFLLVVLLSTFSENQLNFRYVNLFSKELELLRPYLKNIEGRLLTEFLLSLKNAVDSADEAALPKALNKLKELLPKEITQDKKFDEMLVAMQETVKELKKLLQKDFIGHLKHIMYFWPNFIATVPTWRHIVGVFFVSLLFTAISLPKYANALKTITEVIWKHKGGVGLALSALPMLVLGVALLPLNLVIQSGMQLTLIALRALYQVFANLIEICFALSQMYRSFFDSNKSFAVGAFTFMESFFNLTIRLALNVVIDTLNAAIFILSNQNALASLKHALNHGLDSMMAALRPQVKMASQNAQKESEKPSVQGKDKAQVPTGDQKSALKWGIFADKTDAFSTKLPVKDNRVVRFAI